eukprot:CAMPEP_0202694540 /NCGR_PEP_ID=MMETSP1385-20130828/8376_1 /ASSEMBLY_ACC=CAM_ASM_000861 /TAXON_ID=933848 /ORGANISM="Elphidium margaritaceum" /LENGTH=293 /DNA_ID=CAMNT_0049350407 /DNA_START=88 /DNA_END=969 /DNA_ORIENTATION=-
MGVPEPAVRGKMAADGIEDDMFDKYLNPDTAITVNQQSNAVEADTQSMHENEEKQQIDSHNNQPSQQSLVNDQPSQQQRESLAPPPAQSNKLGNGFFASQNFVPNADSELKMDTLQPVPVKKTLLVVNTFVVNTAAFLNTFVTTCESKLHKIHTDIQRMESTMLLLESKLSSIDWLRSAEQGQAPVIPKIDESWETTEFKENAPPPPLKTEGQEESMQPQQQQPSSTDNNNESNEPEAPSQPAEDPLRSDPTVAPFFKMLKFGVPEGAARSKMAREGITDEIQDRVIALHNSG